MHRHQRHRHGGRQQDGQFDFPGLYPHWHDDWRARLHDIAQEYFYHDHDHHDYERRGRHGDHSDRRHGHHDHHHGMWHAGWHFLERLYGRMPWYAMGMNHRDGSGRRGGWGGWGGGFGGMGGDGEGDEFTRGRKLSSTDLQLLLLAMLAEKPAHGYELIKAIESLSNGFYAPSPGMVYPALTYLEELGHLIVAQEGNRKSYSLSDAGREYLGQNKERVEAMLTRLAHIGAKMDSMRRAYSGEGGADVGEGGGWLPELIDAKHKLKHALFHRTDMSPEAQKRIAAILLQAAKDISEA